MDLLKEAKEITKRSLLVLSINVQQLLKFSLTLEFARIMLSAFTVVFHSFILKCQFSSLTAYYSFTIQWKNLCAATASMEVNTTLTIEVCVSSWC